MEVTGKKALVTGAARRVGKAIALALAREGASIVVHYGRSEAAAEETAGEIRAMGVDAWAIQADLASPAEIESMFQQVRTEVGDLHILVNSAASFQKTAFDKIDSQEWDDVLAVNLRAPFLCTQKAAGMMEKAGEGAIVNISDLMGVKPWKKFAHHGTSKAGLIHLTRQSAVELGPRIRVNCVVPGAILPPPGMTESDPIWTELAERVPLARTGDPSDVAKAVLFFIANDFVTGAVLPVDGGDHLG